MVCRLLVLAKVRFMVGIAFVAIACAVGFLVQRAAINKPGRAKTEVPAALAKATKKYYARGGHYIWGKNDCSMFLIDYLKAEGVSFTNRLTTKEFADPVVMERLGLRRVKGRIKSGDVLVYRFFASRASGHCGVVILQDGVLGVVHNSSSLGGLGTHRYEEFVERAEAVGVDPSEILAFRPMQ